MKSTRILSPLDIYSNEPARAHHRVIRPRPCRHVWPPCFLFLEFFTAKIRNRHTRRAYTRAATEFFDWLARRRSFSTGSRRRVSRSSRKSQSIHVATYIEELYRARSAPTAKLRLAALHHLFDWMVIGQIMPTNPAAAVRGPLHIVRRGKTPVLDPAEARQLLQMSAAAVITSCSTASRPCPSDQASGSVHPTNLSPPHGRRSAWEPDPL